MLNSMVRVVASLCLAIISAQTALANPQLASVPGARVNMEMQKPFSMKAKGLDHDHEITVYLPASYDSLEDRSYPVL